MGRLLGNAGLALALILLAALPAWSQAWWAAAAREAKTMQYNRGAVETIRGAVLEVERLGPQRLGRVSQVHLLLQTNREKVIVKLGPENWLAQHNFSLAPGDAVTIRGSRISRPRESFLVAGEVRKGSRVLALRDENGRPLWGKGRR